MDVEILTSIARWLRLTFVYLNADPIKARAFVIYPQEMRCLLLLGSMYSWSIQRSVTSLLEVFLIPNIYTFSRSLCLHLWLPYKLDTRSASTIENFFSRKRKWRRRPAGDLPLSSFSKRAELKHYEVRLARLNKLQIPVSIKHNRNSYLS